MRHPLEGYANSYAHMSKMGDGMVSCRAVEIDIRQNMIPVTRAIHDDLYDRIATATGVDRESVKKVAYFLAYDG